MTREARSVRCPENVLGWIPWYGESGDEGDGVLTPRQRGAVEAHASECAECRAELDMISGAPYEIDVDLPDPDRVFSEITARVDAGEADGPGETILPTPPSPLRSVEPGRTLSDAEYHKLADWILDAEEDAGAAGGEVVRGPWMRSRAVAAVAAAAIFVLGLLGGVLATGTNPLASSDDVYSLAAATPATASDPMIDVVFVDGASARDISQALRAAGTEIVSGPSSVGRYRLRVATAAGDPPASESDLAVIAARLKAGPSPIALFAEPVPR